MNNTCAIQNQVNRQASVARTVFAAFFEIFSTFFNKIFLDTKIFEYIKKLSTKPNTFNTLQNNANRQPQRHHPYTFCQIIIIYK